MRTMITDILAQAGFEIVGEAETGTQAVEKYRQLKPDLVTMDIVMPDMGGIDAVRGASRRPVPRGAHDQGDGGDDGLRQSRRSRAPHGKPARPSAPRRPGTCRRRHSTAVSRH